MDPFVLQQLTTGRHDDLVREAEEFQLACVARATHADGRSAPKPRHVRGRRLRLA